MLLVYHAHYKAADISVSTTLGFQTIIAGKRPNVLSSGLWLGRCGVGRHTGRRWRQESATYSEWPEWSTRWLCSRDVRPRAAHRVYRAQLPCSLNSSAITNSHTNNSRSKTNFSPHLTVSTPTMRNLPQIKKNSLNRRSTVVDHNLQIMLYPHTIKCISLNYQLWQT